MKVNANIACEARVNIMPAIIQNIDFPVLSMKNPKRGEATADNMYTMLLIPSALEGLYPNFISKKTLKIGQSFVAAD